MADSERLVVACRPEWAPLKLACYISGAPRSFILDQVRDGRVRVRKFGATKQAKCVFSVADAVAAVDGMGGGGRVVDPGREEE